MNREKFRRITGRDELKQVLAGIALISLPVGTQLKLGNSAICEVTQIGKECHSPCIIYHTVGDCIMPGEGIFVRILMVGTIKYGDNIEVVKKQPPL
ncbi:MAG: hypothetical protein ABRQ39_19055 [Candidatus Eremiobacterota bacterium]